MEKENKNNDLTSISELGEFKLIEEITKTFEIVNDSTDLGVGDDAAVLDFKKDKVWYEVIRQYETNPITEFCCSVERFKRLYIKTK